MATKTAYTIRLEDQASQSAARVRTALAGVAGAAERVASAVRTEDKAYQAVARTAAKYAQTELRAARAIDSVNKSLLKFNAGGGKAVSGFKRISGAAQAVAGFLGTQLVGATLSAARGFIEAAGLAEQFGSALLDLSKGDVTLSKNWEDELLRLRVPLEQGRQDVIALLAAFKGVKDVNAGIATNDILKLGTALRLTSEQSKSFNKVFKDIGGKGKIQREELVGQLGDVGIGVTSTDFLQQVAKSQKITFAAAEKMLGEGKITASIAIPALIEATKIARGITDLDSAADKAAAGATGSLIALDNAILKMKETVGQGLIDAGAVGAINSVANVILKFAQANPKTVTALAIAFGSLALVLGTLGAAAGYLAVVSAGLGVLTGTLIPAAAAAWAFVAPILVVAAPFIAAGAAIAFLAYQITQLWNELGGWKVIGPAVIGFFTDLATKAWTFGRDIVTGLARGISDTASQAVDAIKGLGNSVVDGAKDLFGIHSPSKVFAEQGKFIDEGLAMGIDDHSDLAFASVENLTDGAISEAEMLSHTGNGVNQTAMANVGAAAGHALGSSSSTTAGGVGPITVSISVDGSKDAASVVEAIRSFFDTDFASLLERQLEGSGA